MALNREEYLSWSVTREVLLTDDKSVYIRALPASLFLKALEDKSLFAPSSLLVRSLCDASGTLLFKPDEQEEAMSLDQASMQKVLAAILELNALHEGDAEKNSSTGEAGQPHAS